MEFTFTANPDWDNLDRWREVQPDGSAVLLDPATGNRLQGPHAWLLGDERLHDGSSFLIRHGSQIDLTILYITHGAAGNGRAEYLGDPSKRWFENQVACSAVYGYEALGWQRQEFYRSLGVCGLQTSAGYYRRAV